MYLHKYQHLKKNKTFIIIFLFVFSLIIRIPIISYFGDTNLENEWRILVYNLIQHQTLAYHFYDVSLEKFLFPSVFMPPLYAYYLYLFSFLNLEGQHYIQLILFSQILLSSLSVIIFYNINRIFFSSKISFYSSLLFSIIPIHLYACGQISSISLQVFFIILFFYFFLKTIENKKVLTTVCLSIISGLLILLRGEFIIIFLTSVFFLTFFFKIGFRKIILIILITLITISPYLIRNIVVFEKIVLTKSLGYNLWKGNNPQASAEGSPLLNSELIQKINLIPKNKYYGINFDNVFMDEAKKNIKENPTKYLNLFIKKFISFLFIDIDSSYPNYYQPLHYLPILLLSITSLLGIFLSNKESKKFNYLIIIFFVHIVIFSCFFIIPRYKLVIIPLQLIFTNVLIDYVRKRFFYPNEQRN